MQIRFDNKVVLITGASTGIGAALAVGFGRSGANVIVHYGSSKAAADHVVASITESGGSARSIQADLADPEEPLRLFSAIEADFGHIDVLVNNAGSMVSRRPVGEMTRDIYTSVVELNFGAVVALCNAVAPGMRERGSGSIINVSSVASVSGGSVGTSVYGAVKGAVASYTRALAKELAPSGVRVNAISPGVIDTPFHDRFTSPAIMEALTKQIPMQRAGRPEECVGTALFLASDELSGYITGQIIPINGGQHFFG